MTEIDVDGVLLAFPETWKVEIFDEWPQYRDLSGTGQIHGCDVVALDDQTLWLIEVKDYSYPGAKHPPNLEESLLRKAIGTLALIGALGRSGNQSNAQEFSRDALAASALILGFHVEPNNIRSDRAVAGLLASFQQAATRAAKKLHIPKAVVSSTMHPGPQAPWQSRRNPETRDKHLVP